MTWNVNSTYKYILVYITLGLRRITKKNALSRLRIKLMRIVRSQERVTCTTKSFQGMKRWFVIIQLFLGWDKVQNKRRNSIHEINYSTKSIWPIVKRKIRIMNHRQSTFYNLPMLPLSNTILLRGIRARELMLDPMLQKKKRLKLLLTNSPPPSDLKVLILALNWVSTKDLKCKNTLNTLGLLFNKNNQVKWVKLSTKIT